MSDDDVKSGKAARQGDRGHMTRRSQVIDVVMSGLAGWEQQELSFSKVKLGWWSCIYAELAERQSEVLSETRLNSWVSSA